MTALVSQALGSILDNYADAIEGGSSWRGSGTPYVGIPGQYSNDLRLKDDSPLTVGAAVSASSFKVGKRWQNNRFVTQNGPAYWVVDASGERRKIQSTANSTYGAAPATDATTFTLASAFTTAPAPADQLTILQGFKRVPNCIDIETDKDGAAEGYDRVFHLSASAGRALEWSGAGTYTYETQLKLRLRMIKFDRFHDWTAALLTNMALLRAALTKREHYDSTYVRALFAVGGEPVVIKDDDVKIVAVDSYRLWYRLDTTLT